MSKKNSNAKGTGRNRNAYCSFCRKSYRDVGPLVEGSGDVYICGECIELCQSIIVQEKRRRTLSEGLSVPLPTPEHVLKRLDQFLGGQAEAKKALASAVHAHYERLGHGHRQHSSGKYGQGHILLVGPTQSSKIFLSRALAHLFGVPFANGHANALTQDNTSFQGNNSPLYKLLVASDFDVEAAQHGMVYLDGLDQPDVQQPVRNLLDGVTSNLLPPGLQMESANILFICGGSFIGLDQVIARRGRHPEQPLTGDDLLALGLIPDLVSRFQVIVPLAPLDEEPCARVVSWVDLKRFSNGDV